MALYNLIILHIPYELKVVKVLKLAQAKKEQISSKNKVYSVKKKKQAYIDLIIKFLIL